MSVGDYVNGPALFGLFESTIFYEGFSLKPIVIDALRINKKFKETHKIGLTQNGLNLVWVGDLVGQSHIVRSIVSVDIDMPREHNILPKVMVFWHCYSISKAKKLCLKTGCMLSFNI